MEPQHIGNLLPQTVNELQKVPEQRTLSTTLKTTLTPQENRVIELKYKSSPVGKLTVGDLFLKGRLLLTKIHVITGWTIPESKELTIILTDQFNKTLVEKYPDLNTEEIEYAFRHYGTQVQDWGKAMNLNLIDSVLVPYQHDRFLISEDERKLTEKPLKQRIFTQEELDNSAREAVQSQYRGYISGVEIINSEINREILLKDGLMKESELVIDFYKRMAANLKTDIYVQVAN